MQGLAVYHTIQNTYGASDLISGFEWAFLLWVNERVHIGHHANTIIWMDAAMYTLHTIPTTHTIIM